MTNGQFLIFQTSTLKSATDNLEEKEQKLVNDCVQQLGKYKQITSGWLTACSSFPGNCLFKLAPEKVWLGELTVPP